MAGAAIGITPIMKSMHRMANVEGGMCYGAPTQTCAIGKTAGLFLAMKG